jgi:GNAT superfamily N-acetyltransferase
MLAIREELPTDIAARERLLDSCFGDARFAKTCERLREGRKPAPHLALVLEREGEIVGTVRLWHVTAGPNRPALLLGPIAVDCRLQGLGLGAKLMREALARAKALGHPPSSSSATRPTTPASASRPRAPAAFGCRGPMSASASSPANSGPARSTARAASSRRPASRRTGPTSRRRSLPLRTTRPQGGSGRRNGALAFDHKA